MNGNLEITISGNFRLLLKRGATETALARGESLEKIGKHMINDIKIGYRGVNFSGWGSRFFKLFLENYDGSFDGEIDGKSMENQRKSVEIDGKSMEIDGTRRKSTEIDGNRGKSMDIEGISREI